MQDEIWPIQPGRHCDGSIRYSLSFDAKILELTKRRHSGKMNDGTELNLFLSVEKLKW
jgi:hypothetical protein